MGEHSGRFGFPLLGCSFEAMAGGGRIARPVGPVEEPVGDQEIAVRVAGFRGLLDEAHRVLWAA